MHTGIDICLPVHPTFYGKYEVHLRRHASGEAESGNGLFWEIMMMPGSLKGIESKRLCSGSASGGMVPRWSRLIGVAENELSVVAVHLFKR